MKISEKLLNLEFLICKQYKILKPQLIYRNRRLTKKPLLSHYYLKMWSKFLKMNLKEFSFS